MSRSLFRAIFTLFWHNVGSPKDVLPKDVLPNDILPNDVLPNDVLPNDVSPKCQFALMPVRLMTFGLNVLPKFFLVLTYLLQAFFEVKIGVEVGLAGAAGPVRPQAGLTQSDNPDFNSQKEVLAMRVVLTVGDERTELLPLVRLGFT
jgi:hypothetical protein